MLNENDWAGIDATAGCDYSSAQLTGNLVGRRMGGTAATRRIPAAAPVPGAAADHTVLRAGRDATAVRLSPKSSVASFRVPTTVI